jgi:hypothetical protein
MKALRTKPRPTHDRFTISRLPRIAASRLLVATLAALLLSVAALALSDDPAAADAPTPADQTELDSNRALWDSLGIRDYRLTTR